MVLSEKKGTIQGHYGRGLWRTPGLDNRAIHQFDNRSTNKRPQSTQEKCEVLREAIGMLWTRVKV